MEYGRSSGDRALEEEKKFKEEAERRKKELEEQTDKRPLRSAMKKVGPYIRVLTRTNTQGNSPMMIPRAAKSWSKPRRKRFPNEHSPKCLRPPV